MFGFPVVDIWEDQIVTGRGREARNGLIFCGVKHGHLSEGGPKRPKFWIFEISSGSFFASEKTNKDTQ